MELDKLGIQLDKLNQDPLREYKWWWSPDRLGSLKEEYGKLKEAALKDAAKRVEAERFAKGVPIITKGFLSAWVAFKEEDYMAGSAALMDICSGIAFLNVPPYGLAIGTIFNLVGQVLSFFLQKEPSLEDKIEKLLLHLKSEQNKETITGVGHSIGSYTTSLKTKCRSTANSKGIADILDMPLTSEKEADDFLVEMKGLKWGLERDNVTFDVPRFANWKVAGYLENQANQRTEGWPEVLGIWCRTYIDLLTANTMLSCLADQNTLDRRLNETQDGNNSLPNLTKHTKRACHKALLNLKALLDKLPESWKPDKIEMLKIVQAVKPAARERGTYAHVGTKNNLYVASGNGSKDALDWVYKDNTEWLNRISIHIPHAEKDSFTPKYEVFTCEYYSPHKIGRHMLDSVTATSSSGLSKRTEVISPLPNEKFLDVSATALINPASGLSSHSDPTAVGKEKELAKDVTLVMLLVENNKNNYANLYVIDEDNKNTKVSWQEDTPWQPDLAGAKDVRNVYLPPTTLPDDPDADAMLDNNANPPGPPLLAQDNHSFLSYAGVRDRNIIYVGTTSTIMQTTYGTVEGPEHWTSYNGIEVDPYYLWVFGKDGIACATHASIIKCRQGKIARPSWTYWYFDNKIFPPEGPEVTSLCPCADGTLVTNIQGNIYTADYKIGERVLHNGHDHGPRIVTSSWVKRGGNAKQVIKMPIPCWSMLESLRANLQA
jgi:hypothetical protein